MVELFSNGNPNNKELSSFDKFLLQQAVSPLWLKRSMAGWHVTLLSNVIDKNIAGPDLIH